jgi:hypothetical protein
MAMLGISLTSRLQMTIWFARMTKRGDLLIGRQKTETALSGWPSNGAMP